MATSVAFILTEARRLLRDTRVSAQRYTDDDYVAGLNAAQRAMVSILPESNIVTAVFQLQAGAKQTLPTDCVRLETVTRNMGLDGATPGPSVVAVTRSEMDAAEADWYNADVDTEVVHFIKSDNDDEFYVYPPQPSTPHRVELMYVQLPANVTAVQTISVRDKYAGALPYYCASYLLGQDGESEGAAGRAQTFMGTFTALIGYVPGGENGGA